MDPHERILAAAPGVSRLYESLYLRANAPDGDRALWIKHTLLVRDQAPSILELWVVLFERDRAPIVAKREVPWPLVSADPASIALDAGGVRLRPDRAEGQIADVRWSLALSGGGAPLYHLPFRWMYRGPFPRAKILTPAPGLRLDGALWLGAERWPVEGWIGIRGHNWGPAHTHAYAYGSCSLWDDGDRARAVDGIAARVLLPGATRPTPWLTTVVGRAPDVAFNRPVDWLGSSSVSPTRWQARLGHGRRPRTVLTLSTTPQRYVGLRYVHPDGATSCCYNTKFADVRYEVGRQIHHSRCGELEYLTASPLPGVPLHPTQGWSQADGDYRSA